MADSIEINNLDLGAKVARSAKINVHRVQGSFVRVTDDKVRGGVIYTDFVRDASVQIHMAGFDPHWVNRKMLFMAYHYPFVQLNLPHLFGHVRSDNEEALKADLKMGFKIVAEIKGVYRHGVSNLIMRMDRADCRFVRLNAV